MSDTAYVATLPDCQLCGGPPHPAAYDVSLAPMGDSRWANVCETVYASMGSPTLGTGRGQRLIVEVKREQHDVGTVGAMLDSNSRAADERQRRQEIHDEMMDALDRGDFEAAFEACGDEDPINFL